MSNIFVWSLGVAAVTLPFICAAIWRGLHTHAPRRATLLVLSGEKSILSPQAPVLAELLHHRMATRGIAALQDETVMANRVEMEAQDSEATLLARARAAGADYGLVVSLDDLNCQVDEARVRDIGTLRVNTTLCVAYRLFEIGSERLLAGQTLAFCRRTSPIVKGTAVGSDVLDGLMREVADRIDQQMELLRLPA